MKKGLYLDDNRTPAVADKVDWAIVRSYDQFVAWVEKYGIPDIISFDHDLSRDHVKYFLDNVAGRDFSEVTYDYLNVSLHAEKTGYHAAQWLCDYCEENLCVLPEIVTVHSANPCGTENILSYLKNWNRHVGKNSARIYKTIW